MSTPKKKPIKIYFEKKKRGKRTLVLRIEKLFYIWEVENIQSIKGKASTVRSKSEARMARENLLRCHYNSKD